MSEIPKWLQVLAPSSLVSALAFYFGWARTNAIASYFGVDPSVLGLSAQDYVLRSVDVLFLPVGAVLSVTLVATWVHSVIISDLRRHPRRYAHITPILVAAGVVLFVVGAIAAWQGLPFATPFLLPQLSPGLGVGFLAYGLSLRRHRLGEEGRWHLGGDDAGKNGRLVMNMVAGMLVVLSLFWATSEYAKALGTGRAQALADQLSRQPGSVIYAQHALHLEAAGVVETDLGDSTAAYRYRYRGLRLVFGDAGNYVLVPVLWSRETGVAIVLPKTKSVRVDFTTVGLP